MVTEIWVVFDLGYERKVWSYVKKLLTLPRLFNTIIIRIEASRLSSLRLSNLVFIEPAAPEKLISRHCSIIVRSSPTWTPSIRKQPSIMPLSLSPPPIHIPILGAWLFHAPIKLVYACNETERKKTSPLG